MKFSVLRWLKRWFWRLLWRAWVPTGGYFAMSRFLREVLPSQRRRTKIGDGPVEVPVTVDGIVALMSKLEWTRDGFRGLFDYFKHPEAIWYHLTEDGRIDPGESPGDCDDWVAVFAALFELIGLKPRVMNVFWAGGGHNLCVIDSPERDGTLWHFSNYRENGTRGRPWKGYRPFGRPWKRFESYAEVAESVAFSGEVVGWCVTTPGLDGPREWAYGDPIERRFLHLEGSTKRKA